MRSEISNRILNRISNKTNYNLIYNSISVFGSTVVDEVLDLVACSSPEIMYENFVKLRMNRFRECLEMLFNINDEEFNYTPSV